MQKAANQRAHRVTILGGGLIWVKILARREGRGPGTVHDDDNNDDDDGNNNNNQRGGLKRVSQYICVIFCLKDI